MARPKSVKREVARFDIHQRFQHLLLVLSFTTLALTGLPLKFNSLAVSQWWIHIWGGIDITRTAHHFAAWVLIFASLYHVVYLAYGVLILKKPVPISMIPGPKDVRDFLHELGYYAGIVGTPPQFDRFSWREKFDYWAVFWGMAIIGVSGLILMYPVMATKILPGWMVPVALIAHGDEAVLAVVWIVVVHFFFGHLAPSVFPLNKSMFTGKVPWQRYRAEHPLDAARLGRQQTVGIPAAETARAAHNAEEAAADEAEGAVRRVST